MQSSLGSPGARYDGQQLDHLHDSPVNINDDMKAASPVGVGSGTAAGVAAGMSAATGVGLGVAVSPMKALSEVSSLMNICTYYMYIYFCVLKKKPPSRLLLSRSNTALKESAAKAVSAIAVNGEDEERGHMSDVRVESPCPIVSDY